MIRFAHLLLVIVTVASYLPPYVDPEWFWPIATLGLLSPSLWFLLLLFGVYWLLKRDRAVLLSLVALLLGWDMIGNAFALPGGRDDSPAETTTVSVLSLNGKGFRETGITDFFRENPADLLFFQEFSARDPEGVTDKLSTVGDWPYTYRAPGGQLAIFSRFPLKNTRTEYFANRANGYLTAEVETPSGTWTLINVHLQTNAISHLAGAVTQEPRLREKQTWHKIKTMFGRYARSNQTRTRQVEKILEVVENSRHPVLAAGDFNDVPTSYLYRRLRRPLNDAHLARGTGLGTTFPGLLPGLRIDYILPGPRFRVHTFERLACPFSDHHAVRAELMMTTPPPENVD